MIKLPENYTERPMADELNLVSRLTDRFNNVGKVMPDAQRDIYKNITEFFVEDVKNFRGYPKRIHKPTVADVGCGLGIGSNIMSKEAQFVWGIDTNDHSIEFARQMFEREPNNIYYTPQVSFDVINVMDEDRGMMQFDYVTCIEVIEHIPSKDAEELVTFLNRLVKRNKNGEYITDDSRTKIFVTSPNRNAPEIQDDTPRNEHHCYEATAGEMYEFFTQHYQAVTVYNKDMEPQDLDTTQTPLVYKLENPLR